ncbi:hypothetical protein GCM10023259_090760 [Thermocatellispora tengchongensis]
MALAGVFYVKYRSPWYESRVTIAFVTTTTGFHGQLYDHFSDNQVFTAIAAGRLFDNPRTRAEIRALGGHARLTFDVAHWGNEEVPVYDQPYATVRSVSQDPVESRRTLDIALKLLTDRLKGWQTSSGANGKLMITWQPIDTIVGPVPQSLQINRASAGLMAIGGLLALWAAATVGRLTSRRRTTATA